ncbi:MAG: Multifunctional fusion protein [Chloroflexi bacterium]|nr:Multifunctional fusion protein [Chloroflexota bacterium]
MSDIVAGRTGIMGGTFDPVHRGHLAIAEAAVSALGLERVLFLPAGVPPHKQDAVLASAKDRVAMVQLAIAGKRRFVLSRVDVDRPGPSWTAESIRLIAAAERAAGREPDLFLIVSAETFAALPGWHEPGALLRACRIAVVPRAGYPTPDPAWIGGRFPGLEDRIGLLDGPRLPVSSTEVRERVAAGRAIERLVPAAVRRYIADHGLYQPVPGSPGTTPEDRAPVTDAASPPAASSPAASTPAASTPRPDGLPRRKGRAAVADRSSLDIARRVVALAEDKKAADIVLLDLSALTAMADYFVICSGGSERDRVIALGAGRLRERGRPRLHPARARLLPAGKALVGGEDGPAGSIGEVCRTGCPRTLGSCHARWRSSTIGP